MPIGVFVLSAVLVLFCANRLRRVFDFMIKRACLANPDVLHTGKKVQKTLYKLTPRRHNKLPEGRLIDVSPSLRSQVFYGAIKAGLDTAGK